MRLIVQRIKSLNNTEVVRYIVNGLMATGVHYGVLTLNIEIFNVPSAAIANMIAAFFGITASFLGSRYFVFRNHQGGLINQAMPFVFLYASIACLHGLVLFLWSDIYRLDYRTGFLIATILQVLFSYWGNKKLVFKA
jgi:putative flippase GtrA